MQQGNKTHKDKAKQLKSQPPAPPQAPTAPPTAAPAMQLQPPLYMLLGGFGFRAQQPPSQMMQLPGLGTCASSQLAMTQPLLTQLQPPSQVYSQQQPSPYRDAVLSPPPALGTRAGSTRTPPSQQPPSKVRAAVAGNGSAAFRTVMHTAASPTASRRQQGATVGAAQGSIDQLMTQISAVPRNLSPCSLFNSVMAAAADANMQL